MCLGRQSCNEQLVRAPKPTIAEACGGTAIETSGQPTLFDDGSARG
jgi:hypothetical protein